MDFEEFRQDLKTIISNTAFDFGIGISAAFAEEVTQMMQEAEYLNGDFQESFFKGIHSKKRSNMRIDGYVRDEVTGDLILFIVHYVEKDTNMTKTLAESNFKMLASFVDAAVNTDFYQTLEDSLPVAELVEVMRDKMNDNSKCTFILLTNARRSSTLMEIKNFSLIGKMIDCQVWDIERIFEVYSSMQIREPIEIDFTEYGEGIPCLRADNAVSNSYESFLCVISGKTLADIYDRYGSRLLEGNVRSFLSTKRAVNKKIRASILNEPEMFFAFNNGIAATAKELNVKSDNNGSRIVLAVDFQIINGGQTTVSLSNARFKDKNTLENIFVQMKLTRIGDMANEQQEKLIEKISRSSNSQNKVSEADFFSTHPFHVEIEKISTRLFAPAIGGVQFQTKWFYERARGQYLQEQMRMTVAQKKSFQRQNPKNQVITKTDLAKYRMAWSGNPHIVSKGAQANFIKFAEEINTAWEKDNLQFNERYFKESVALAILWQNVEKIVSTQPWYNSYRANIVAYSVALFHHCMKKKFSNMEFNLIAIWNAQSLPDMLKSFFAELSCAVNKFITDPSRPITNVTQWCKQSTCWAKLQETLLIEIPDDFAKFMEDKNSARNAKKDARSDQKIVVGVQAQEKIIQLDGSTWRKIFADASKLKLIATPAEAAALKTAMKIPLRIPTDFQCVALLNLIARLEENGHTYF